MPNLESLSPTLNLCPVWGMLLSVHASFRAVFLHMWSYFTIRVTLGRICHHDLHFTHKAKWSSVLCLKGCSHQVAICSCLFSCPHPAPSSSCLVLVAALPSSPPSPHWLNCSERPACSPASKPSLVAALPTSPLGQWFPRGSLTPFHSLGACSNPHWCSAAPSWPGPEPQWLPGVFCTILTFHFLSISRCERTILVCCRLSWYFPQLSV